MAGEEDQAQLRDKEDHVKKALRIRWLLTIKYPQNRIYQKNLAQSYDYLGNIYAKEGRCDDALVQYQEGSKLADSFTDFDPSNLEGKRLSDGLKAAVANLKHRIAGAQQEAKEGCEARAQ
jgi:hypothetical protein